MTTVLLPRWKKMMTKMTLKNDTDNAVVTMVMMTVTTVTCNVAATSVIFVTTQLMNIFLALLKMAAMLLIRLLSMMIRQITMTLPVTTKKKKPTTTTTMALSLDNIVVAPSARCSCNANCTNLATCVTKRSDKMSEINLAHV